MVSQEIRYVAMHTKVKAPAKSRNTANQGFGISIDAASFPLSLPMLRIIHSYSHMRKHAAEFDKESLF